MFMKKIVLVFTAGLSLSFGFLSFNSNAQLNFSPAAAFATGNSPYSVNSADFNGDGKIDLAVANYSGFTISVLLGNGAGSFAPAVTYNVGTNPHSIISADFNGDGFADLATANEGGTYISVLLGNGNGTFNTSIMVPLVIIDTTGTVTNNSHPESIISADFNGDGKADLATANSYGNGSVSILLGDGTGHFGAATSYNMVGDYPIFIISSDFNGDGKIDLATVNNTSNNVSILLGNGSGGFGNATNFAVGNNPFSIVSNDFNGDGKIDLAVTCNAASKVSLLLGDGAGNFGAAISIPTGIDPFSITSADFNADGKADLAVTGQISSAIYILLGDGLGSFATGINFSVGNQPRSIIYGDFNGDGKIDLATTNEFDNNVSILLNTTPTIAPPICLVTVDSTHTHNLLVWEKTNLNLTAIDSFEIYREITTNNYQRIGAVSKDSMSTFDDWGANPASTGYRYKLKSKSAAGVESVFSNYHNTIYLTNTGANFSWTPYQIENNPTPVAAYYVYRDDNSTGNFQTIGFTTGNQFGYTDVNFAAHPNSQYYVEAMMSGGTCLPTRSGYGSSRSNVKHFGSSGIQELIADAGFSISPNPFSTQTIITFNEEQKNTTIKIMDVLGKQIKSIDFKGRTLIIEKEEMKPGIYFLQISDEIKNGVNRKIVVQ